MDENQLEENLKKLEEKRIYLSNLLRCYEAKIERVEPLSDEFESTMAGILNTRRELNDTAIELMKVKYEKATKGI